MDASSQVSAKTTDGGAPWKLYYKGAGGWSFTHQTIGVMECRTVGMNKKAAHAVLAALNWDRLQSIEYAISLLEIDGYTGKSLQYLKAVRDAEIAVE